MSDKVMTPEEIADEVFSGADCCGDHPIGVSREDVVEILASHGNYDDWDTDGWVLVRLKDGRFARVWEWSDSSGHGCQCSAGASFFSTREEALQLGLTAGERE